jgi:hypothetical protein
LGPILFIKLPYSTRTIADAYLQYLIPFLISFVASLSDFPVSNDSTFESSSILSSILFATFISNNDFSSLDKSDHDPEFNVLNAISDA